MMNKHLKVLTSGSGPSYSKWSYWHTWTRLLPLYFYCDHKDVSGPAAGNKFICRSVVNSLVNYPADIVLVQWNLGRMDLYLENKKIINKIINSNSERNFIVDIQTSKTTHDYGYWCSSFDNTIPWKKYYNTHIKNDTAVAVDDLEQMVLLQELCKKRSIEYFFFTNETIDHAYLSNNQLTQPYYNEIDWQRQITNKSINELYNEHPSRVDHIEIKNAGRHIPNPIFQLWFLENIVEPCLKLHGINKNNNHNMLSSFVEKQQRRLGEISVH